MKLFLIRHGESIQNTKENYEIKLPDHKVYLSKKGCIQANNAGEFLNKYVHENDIDLTNATLWVSPYDVALRTKQFLETIFRDDRENLFIVSHGTTIRTIVMNWFHYSPEWFNAEQNMKNCSIRFIDGDSINREEKYIYGGPIKE